MPHNSQLMSYEKRVTRYKTHPNPSENPSAAILLAANGPAQANLNVPRELQPRKHNPSSLHSQEYTNQKHFRGNKLPSRAVETKITSQDTTNWKTSTFTTVKVDILQIELPLVIDDPALHKSIKGYRYATRNSKPTSYQETNAQLENWRR